MHSSLTGLHNMRTDHGNDNNNNDNDKEVIENRASRWPSFLSSLRKKKTRLIEAVTRRKEEEEQQHGSKKKKKMKIACKGHSSEHKAGFKDDRRRRQKEQQRDGGRKHYRRVLVATLPCIPTQSSFIRSTSTKILPFSDPPPSSSSLSSPSSCSPSSSSSYSDTKISCATNTLTFAPIHTSEDASSSSLDSHACDSVATTDRASKTRDDNEACKVVLQVQEEKEKEPCKRVFSVVIPAQGKAARKAKAGKRKMGSGRNENEKIMSELLVVKVCAEPYSELVEWIGWMILSNMETLWEEAHLRNLLRSYLYLNSPRHHSLIKLAFAHVITTIHSLLDPQSSP